MELVLASNNPKKLAELEALFAPLDLKLVAQGSLRIREADEPHHTFVENALAKARHAAAESGLPAIADDSGLCVPSLGGEPGVHSAQYAIVDLATDDRERRRTLQDAANNRLLLERMNGIEDRRAHYICLLVAVRSPDDPDPLIASGRWEGEVLQEPRGSGGFGYDPLMYVSKHGCSVAELPRETKNAQSHRALAVRQMLHLMREAWQLG